MARIFKEGLRKQDYAARWGGEEFILLLPQTSCEGGRAVAEKLRKRIEKECFYYMGNEIKITVTFGVHVISKELTVDELITLADKALYEGKQMGRNCVVTL